MYDVAASLTPETYEDLATAVYSEMAMAGVTVVGEFHYVHHQTGGVPYTDPNEMGHALIRAARRAGIRICLLDAGYLRSGFGNETLDPVQERFSDGSADAWLDRVEELVASYDDDHDVEIGVAPHSVRAVARADLETAARRVSGRPIHIHVSEQPAENEACVQATSLTPTGLLAATDVLRPDTMLIHATHVTTDDIKLISGSGAGVCYCATTERDLGDGLGPAGRLAAAGVDLAVGSDSHAVIDLFEEARGMELHQRLADGRRGVLAAESLLEAATAAGSAALGFGHGRRLESGAPADFVVVDTGSPRLYGLDLRLVDSVVFSATASDITDVFVAGRQIVSTRQHDGWDEARTALLT